MDFEALNKSPTDLTDIASAVGYGLTIEMSLFVSTSGQLYSPLMAYPFPSNTESETVLVLNIRIGDHFTPVISILRVRHALE